MQSRPTIVASLISRTLLAGIVGALLVAAAGCGQSCGAKRVAADAALPVTTSVTDGANPISAADAAREGAATISSDAASSDGGFVSATERERDAMRAFRAGMSVGRKATVAARYEDAIQAFTKALDARPREPTALAERGYAELLAGKIVRAERDLSDAKNLTKDKKVLAQIWFNLGLVNEKLGKPRQACTSFDKSNELAPTSRALELATKWKSVPDASCAISFEDPYTHKGTVVRDWVGVDARLREELGHAAFGVLSSEPIPPAPATESLARKELCLPTSGGVSYWGTGDEFPDEGPLPSPMNQACAGSGPWVVALGTTFNLVAKTPGGLLVFSSIASTGPGRCGPGIFRFEAKGESSMLHVTYFYAFTFASSVCLSADGHLQDCSEGGEMAGSACGRTGTFSRTDMFFDTTTREPLPTLSAYYNGEAGGPLTTLRTWKVSQEAKTFVVESPTCSQRISTETGMTAR